MPPIPESSWSPPVEFEEYRIVRPLGRGRTGTVYLAQDTLLERPVAVKFIPAVGSEAAARFLNEARASARVQHPNVVAVYRVGQLDDRAYLVSEYIRGVGLERLKKPMPWEKALTLARELLRGLAAAHRRGVLHRDIKPGNAMLTEAGQVKLLDFGLAKLLGAARAPLEAPSALDPAGALVGTPWYMSPEAWRGEEHTAQSDLYSLGALLFELCAGTPPFPHTTLPELARAVGGEARPSLREAAPDVDPEFAGWVEHCLALDPQARPASADLLLDALEALEAGRAQVAIPDGNPYRGLRAFDAEHRALFFGRGQDLRAVLDRLRGESFVALTGDSGVGKSSLALAGVLPALLDGQLEDGRRYSLLRLVPGRRPVAALAQACGGLLTERPEQLEALMREGPERLARRIKAHLKASAGVVLYLDQLEELITLAAPEDAGLFAEVLAPLARGVGGVRLLASARSDFLTRLAGLGALGEQLGRSLYLVAPLSPAQVREAIVGPARLTHVRFESEALVSTLVDATVNAGGGLPLLQFALAQLWDARDPERQQITSAALEALGGVGGALARHADQVIDARSPAERAAAKNVLLRLVTEQGTRARRSVAELTDGDPRYVAALEALVRGRLLVAREGEEGGACEVAHEALMHGWDTLAGWIEDARETRELQRRLEAAARDWEKASHRAELLWGEGALAAAANLGPDLLSQREQRFLTASRRRLRRIRSTRIAIGVGVAVAIAGAVLGMRLKARLERDATVSADLARARTLLAQARREEDRERTLRAAAFAAFDARQPAQGEARWQKARAQAERVGARYAKVNDLLDGALALDPERDDVRSALSDVLLSQALRADRDGQEEVRELLAQRLQRVDRQGSRWAAWTAPATLLVHTPPGGRLEVERYPVEESGTWTPTRVALPGASTSGAPLSLPPGSYLLVWRSGDRVQRLAVALRRGERREVSLRPPARIPEGMVYVPPGRFRFGSGDEESVRQFLNAVPVHDVSTAGYLIARDETTWAQYLAWLDALGPKERAEHLPRGGSSGLYGGLRLRKLPSGRWELSLQPSSVLLTAQEGEKLRYPGRTRRAAVDWSRLPVVGITSADAAAYAAWLDQSGRLPGARLCDEREWERAGRGADERTFPAGELLPPDDANFDLTYGKDPRSFGPDEVGSHPASDSPYGVRDLAGNVWEWTRSALAPDQAVARGGSYYFAASSCRLTNREIPEPSFRDLTVGMRICADLKID